jgi:hypothetical protein
MPERFIINGQIKNPNEEPMVGVTIRAIEKDLPSLESLRGTEPLELGRATTNSDGYFEIIYTDDLFRRGEASESETLRLRRKAGPDIIFHVLDAQNQDMEIVRLEVNEVSFDPSKILFNAPAEVRVLLIVKPREEEVLSEYEEFLLQLAPVLEDLPLAELTDEDVVFLLGELGINSLLIEWLRRSALLATETGLPIEAFYGWGRKDMPDALTVLVAVAQKDLPRVLMKLTDLPDEQLSHSLLAAIAENIIPATLRDRVNEIVRHLKRRDQVLRQVIGRLQDSETKGVLAGYSVITFDQSVGGENRGLDITDSDGIFLFDFYVPRDIPSDSTPHEFRLEVHSPNGEKLPEDGLIFVDMSKPETEVLPAIVKVPKPEIDRQREQLAGVLREAPLELKTYLQQHIQTLADIRRMGGLSRLPDLPESGSAFIRKLEALADLDRISPDVAVSMALLDNEFDSVLAIADTPRSEFVFKVGRENVGLNELDAAKLHVMATVQTSLLNNILAGMAADVANGLERSAPEGEDQ